MTAAGIIIDRHMRYKTDTPRQTPDNRERYAEFRQRWPHMPVNAHPWKWLHKYDPAPVSPDEIAEAYDFKYGN